MKAKAVQGRPNRKGQIVAATERLLRTHSITRVTTRMIAGEVPCSEGAIYVHFKDRLELLLQVLQESLPDMRIPLRRLEMSVGKDDPLQNLEVALAGLMRFHERVAPMLCSLIGEPEMLSRFQHSLQESGKGPHRGIATLCTYMEQEQKRGRIGKTVDTMAAAQMLMASSFFHVFTKRLLGRSDRLDLKRLVATAIARQ